MQLGVREMYKIREIVDYFKQVQYDLDDLFDEQWAPSVAEVLKGYAKDPKSFPTSLLICRVIGIIS
ncbi:MAG: hypothetical protein KDD14_10035 [Saprospiraceae bacterium]|nr:hypothetical protein [Saprospiraceae bacterium]